MRSEDLRTIVRARDVIALIDPLWPRLVMGANIFIVAYLAAPLVVVIATSFNATLVVFPPREWRLDSYAAIPPSMYSAFYTSLEVAIASVSIATVVAVLAALGLMRGGLRGTGVLLGFFRLPLQVPAIVTGLGLYQFYVALAGIGLHLRGELVGLIIAHVLLVFPFLLTTLTARLATIDSAFEDVSYGLGAGVLRTTILVTIPLLRPAIVAGAFLAFLFSFDDVAVSLFLITPGNATLPVELLLTAESSLLPNVYAVAAIVIVLSVLTAMLIERLVGLRTVLSN